MSPLFPQFPEKHHLPAIITPEKVCHYLKQIGEYPTAAPPHTFIFCYQSLLSNQILRDYRCQPGEGDYSFLYFLEEHPGVAFAKLGPGAPSAVFRLEQMIAWGTKKFISVGTAGALQSDLMIGDLVLCEAAIRDEGTSHHYLPPAPLAFPSPEMTARLAAALASQKQPYRTGNSWTTDAIFRQTREEVQHYQNLGVLSVEMEASALFTVASCRGVEIGALFTISDSLAGPEWKPSFREERTVTGLRTLFEAALLASAMP